MEVVTKTAVAEPKSHFLSQAGRCKKIRYLLFITPTVDTPKMKSNDTQTSPPLKIEIGFRRESRCMVEAPSFGLG